MAASNLPLKSIIKALVTTPFQHGWQWVVEFDGNGAKPPNDFDIYAKSIEHGGMTIEYEEKQIGANTINSPTHKAAGTVTIIIRDHEDGRCEKFFSAMADKVLNKDGTVNLPKDYLFNMRMFRLKDDGTKIPYKKWVVSAAEYGSFTRSRDEAGTFVTYPMVFKKYQALGKGGS